MKKIFILILLSIITLFANDLDWSKSFFNAKKEALTENKMIFVMFTQEDCPACDYMKDVVFENEELAEYMQTNFILVEVNMHDKKELSHLKVYGTPTTYIFTKEAKQIGRQIVGSASAKIFLKTLKNYKYK